MKKIALTAVCICTTLSMLGQNNEAVADDFGRIALTPVVLEESGIPSHAHKLLTSKLTQIVTKCGLAADSAVPRFVITADTDLLAKEVTATAPAMTAVEVATTLYVGDAETGQLYGSYSYEPAKGVGTNDTKAYMEALKKINVNDKEVAKFIDEAKVRILEYYNSQIDFITAEAQALLDSQKYDDALALLSSVPTVCKDAHAKAMAMITKVFQAKIDVEGMVLYNEAAALWKTSKTADAALAAVELLAQINPLSSAAAQGRALVKEVENHHNAVAAHRREIEERNWAFKQQEYADSQVAAAEQRQFDYEVYMNESSSGAYASQLALDEVKEVVTSFTSSPNGYAGSNAGGAMYSKISSWFN